MFCGFYLYVCLFFFPFFISIIYTLCKIYMLSTHKSQMISFFLFLTISMLPKVRVCGTIKIQGIHWNLQINKCSTIQEQVEIVTTIPNFLNDSNFCKRKELPVYWWIFHKTEGLIINHNLLHMHFYYNTIYPTYIKNAKKKN